MAAPETSPEAAGISADGTLGAEVTDADDPSLPEGARNLAKGEDPTAAGDPDEVLCKTTGSTGSRLSKKRICMTRAEWDANYERSKRGMDNFKNDKSMGTPLQ